MGRHSSFAQETAIEICERLALGESLRAICRDDHMPDCVTVFRWLRTNDEFRSQYARAREDQAERMLDEIIAISDDGANDTYVDDEGKQRTDWDVVARSKLRVDARKWAMSKLAPKKYGDKVDITTGNESLNLTAEQRAAKLQAIAAAAAQRRDTQDDGSDLL